MNAWWVCTKCKVKLTKVGTGTFKLSIEAHRKGACGPTVGCSIKNFDKVKPK